MFALLGVLLLIGARAFLAGFERVEMEQAALESERVLAVLERQRDDLERTARDYAEWDDTIAYAAGTMPAFAEANLASSSFANLRVHQMLVFDRSGNPAGGARVPPGETDAIATSPQNFSTFDSEVSPRPCGRHRKHPDQGFQTHRPDTLDVRLRAPYDRWEPARPPWCIRNRPGAR